MYRLVRIEGFHNFQVNSKLKFVLYNGSEYKSYKGCVNSSYFIYLDDVSNHQIFEDLGITDPDINNDNDPNNPTDEQN